jgi:hypothetical protein
MDLRADALIEHLVLQGGIEIADINLETGETYYSITNKLKDIAPDIYQELKDQYEDHLFIMKKRGPESMIWRING